MAIGTAAAIGLGVAGIGSVVSSSNNRKAASNAAQISQQASDASVGLQREIYGQNRDMLNPFAQRGNQAGGAINALLGLGGSQVQGGPENVGALPGFGGPNALAQFQGVRGGPSAQQAFGLGMSPEYSYQDGGFIARPPMEFAGAGFGVQPSINNQTTFAPTSAGPQGQTAQQAANSAFDMFRNSTGYQFRVGEAQDALNSGFAGSGLLQSGAALRSLDDLRQNMASAEFSNYLGQLGQQQAVGAGSASALAGVGQNFAGNVAQLNTLNANNQANAAIARGQNNVFANLAGTLGGGILGYAG
jgi:hypothetical protein